MERNIRKKIRIISERFSIFFLCVGLFFIFSLFPLWMAFAGAAQAGIWTATPEECVQRASSTNFFVKCDWLGTIWIWGTIISITLSIVSYIIKKVVDEKKEKVK